MIKLKSFKIQNIERHKKSFVTINRGLLCLECALDFQFFISPSWFIRLYLVEEVSWKLKNWSWKQPAKSITISPNIINKPFTYSSFYIESDQTGHLYVFYSLERNFSSENTLKWIFHYPPPPLCPSHIVTLSPKCSIEMRKKFYTISALNQVVQSCKMCVCGGGRETLEISQKFNSFSVLNFTNSNFFYNFLFIFRFWVFIE